MSMNNANVLLSPCELLRQLNDLFQGDTAFDSQIRDKLAQIEEMTKELSICLDKHEPNFQHSWKKNPTYQEDFKRRKLENYKFSKV